MPTNKTLPKKKKVDKEESDSLEPITSLSEVIGVESEPNIKRVEDIFSTLYAIDVRKDVFQKGGYDYISWATAVRLLLQNYPLSDWTTVKHKSEKIRVEEKTVTNNYRPYFYDPAVQGYMVEVQVTIVADDGQITRNETLPVINFRNQVINEPDQMAINKAVKRCFVKCLANMGLGLRIYEGDNADYSEIDEKVQDNDNFQKNIIEQATEVFDSKKVVAVNDNDCDYINAHLNKKFPKSAKNRETYFKSLVSSVLNQYKASTVAKPDELLPDECTKLKQHLMKG
jgi:hypothetical protein